MSAHAHYLRFYVADHLADTMHLSTAEHGAYMLLLCHSWRTGPLPDNGAALARIARCTPREWQAIAPVVLPFFTATPNGLVQQRLERERQRKDDGVAQRKAAGKASADARKASREANARPTIVQRPLGQSSNGTLHILEPDFKEEEPPSLPSVARPPRGGRLPPDWQPSDDDAHFALGLGLDDRRIAANFRDYWHAKAGKDATKLDWSATWRGWCRREAERSKAPAGREPQSRLSWMLNPGAPA